MKSQFPLLIVFVSGVFMIIQYFVPTEGSERAYEFLLDWTIIIGIFALALGIWSLVRVSLHKIRNRQDGWQFSAVTIAGLFGMILFGTPWFGGHEGYMFRAFFDHIMIPIQSTMFSLLAFFIASAAYRAFRARSILSTVLLLAAFIVMARLIPMGETISGYINEISNWILLVPNLAAKRAIWIGVGLGIVATSLKVVLGIERSYLGLGGGR